MRRECRYPRAADPNPGIQGIAFRCAAGSLLILAALVDPALDQRIRHWLASVTGIWFFGELYCVAFWGWAFARRHRAFGGVLGALGSALFVAGSHRNAVDVAVCPGFPASHGDRRLESSGAPGLRGNPCWLDFIDRLGSCSFYS